MRPIHTIIFHCSATDKPQHDDIKVIKSWHLAKGWKDVGYHYFIRKNGLIEFGRPLNTVGAHVEGHNTGTVGVCFAGLNDFTKAQMKSIHSVIQIIEGHVGKALALKSHRDYTNKKTCPNFKLDKFLSGKLEIVHVYPPA